MNKINEMNVFLNTIKKLQSLNTSTISGRYMSFHSSIIGKKFKISGVSISFRIAFKPWVLEKIGDNKEYKLKIKNDLRSFLKNKDSYTRYKYQSQNQVVLSIDKLAEFLNKISNKDLPNIPDSNLNEISEIFSIEILLVKRASSTRDKYSGDIAFPGGKFEEADLNDYNTAIRETKEEIGICLNNLIDKNLDLDLDKTYPEIYSSYLGKNAKFNISIDFKYQVNSHIFTIIDFFKETESKIKLSPNEISHCLFVPIEYFLKIDPKDIIQMAKLSKSFNMTVHKRNVIIKKLILLENEQFLIYGLTLRKIINLLNLAGDYLKLNDNFNFDDDVLYMKKSLLSWVIEPKKNYKLLKLGLGLMTLGGIYSKLSKF